MDCKFNVFLLNSNSIAEMNYWMYRLRFKGQSSMDREGHIKTDRESMKTMARPFMDFLTSKLVHYIYMFVP